MRHDGFAEDDPTVRAKPPHTPASGPPPQPDDEPYPGRTYPDKTYPDEPYVDETYLDQTPRPGYADEPTQPLFDAEPPPAPPPPPPVEPPAPPPWEPPSLAPPDDADTVRDLMRRTKRGPLRRFTLYASGVDTRVLWYAAIEESEYVVQGTLVILTSIVAAVSGLAAASYLTSGRFVLNPVTILIGLAWGLLIFFFDRALVSGTFNPYRFTRAEVDSLRDLRVDTAWSSVVDQREQEGRAGLRRAGEITRVVLVASLRIALAVATSYIAAEMALFLVFQPEVNARTADLLRQSQVQRVAAIHAEFDAKRAARTTDRNELTGSSDPDIIRLTQQTADLDKQVESATRDLGILQAAAAAELDGDRYQGTLSDGTVVTTTGRRGDGAAARSLAQRRDTQQRLTNDLTTRRDRTRADLDARRAAIKTTNQPALTTLDERENSDAADEKAALAAAVADPSAINGLLLRQAALDKLTHDLHPETLADDPVPPCTGLFAWVCHIRNAIVPPTPMGPAIVAYRVIFFVIEILPITYKVITSLRRRRPYDVAKAALEEASNVDMIRLLDRQLHDASREVSTRSDQRYAARPTANGSDARPWSNSPQGRL